MNLKMIFLSLILFILSMAAVSATDLNGADINGQIAINDVIKSSDVQDSVNTDDLKSNGNFNDLQNLINNAEAGSVIVLDRDYNQGSSAVSIGKPITIDGQGHILDGGKKHTLMICYSSSITLKNIIFQNSYHKDSRGAIDIIDEGDVRVINCTFKNNVAHDGGAITLTGLNLIVENSTFIKNSAEKRYAGAIFTLSNLVVNNCTFDGNTAQDSGGAIFVSYTPLGTAVIRDSTFINNYAYQSGGAISNSGDINIDNCNFISNTAYTDSGGAIWNNRWLSFSFRGSNFTNNVAQIGGAIFSKTFDGYVTNLRFIGNHATEGGALAMSFFSGGDYVIAPYLKDCYFENNYCDYDFLSENTGGAITFYGDNYHDTPSQLTLNNCTFKSNYAPKDGGAINIIGILRFEGNPSTFIENKAGGNGGAIHCEKTIFFSDTPVVFEYNSAKNGGAIATGDFGTVANLTFRHNSATSGHGGAVYVKNSFYDKFQNCVFEENSASGNGGAVSGRAAFYATFDSCIFFKNTAKDSGGAIHLNKMDSHLKLLHNVFLGNTANKGKATYNCGYYEAIQNNFWGDSIPTTSNNMIIEWKVFSSNKHHTDSNPLKMNLELDKSYCQINESVTATLSFLNSNGNLYTGEIFDSNLFNWNCAPNIPIINKQLSNNAISYEFSPQKTGNYNVSVGLYTYHLSDNFSALNLTITAPEITAYYNSPKSFEIYLAGDKDLIANQEIKITCNNHEYYFTSDENGYKSVSSDYIAYYSGTYTVTIEVNHITAKSKIKVLSTINAGDIVRSYGDHTPFNATFTYSNGQYLPESTLVGYLIGDSILTFVNVKENGLAFFNIAYLESGYYPIGLYNFETSEFRVFYITILPKLENNDETPENNIITSENNYFSGYLIHEGGIALNNTNTDSYASPSKIANQPENHTNNITNSQSNNNNYLIILIILLILLIGGVLIKKYRRG